MSSVPLEAWSSHGSSGSPRVPAPALAANVIQQLSRDVGAVRGLDRHQRQCCPVREQEAEAFEHLIEEVMVVNSRMSG